jgi:hypothetical protein
LSYSRAIYLRFFLNARMENFLRGHVGAFTTWRGVPRILLSPQPRSNAQPDGAPQASAKQISRGCLG